MINEKEFLSVLDFGINKHFKGKTEKEKDYTRKKGEILVTWFKELEKSNYFKELNETEIKLINEKLDNTMNNFEQVRRLYLSLINMVMTSEHNKPKTEINFVDEFGNNLTIHVNQMIIIFGWFYSSLCEVMKHLLMSIIDFKKISNTSPTGLGDIKRIFNKKFPQINLLNDIDTWVRNSFVHVDFELSEVEIIYYESKTKKFLKLENFFWLIIYADLTTYVIMSGIFYYLNKVKMSINL